MTLVRALAGSFKLPTRVPSGDGPAAGLLSMSSLLGSDAQSGIEAYKQIGAIYGPIRRLCESVALTNWSLYQQTDAPGEASRAFLDDATAPARHPATALWTQPNRAMTRRLFLFLSQLYQETTGGCYWLLVQGGTAGAPIPQQGVTAPIELWPVPITKIIPTPDPDTPGSASGYTYIAGSEKIPLPVQAVVPVGWPDPANPLKFAGPLASVMTDAEAEKYAAQYNRNVFLNNARPGGVIEFATPLPRDRFEEIVMRWREQHQGVNNVARVAILEGGKWVDVGQSNTDMEYEKLRKLDRETFMFALGMPFAVMQTNGVNLANATMADKQYYRWTLRPRLENIKEPLNQRVLPFIAPMLTMDYELPAPEDESFDVYAASIGFAFGMIKQNEARAAMGYDADPEGDRYIYDITGNPLTMPSPRLPRRPTTLSYRAKARHPQAAAHETSLHAEWTRRLRDVRESYLGLEAVRRGR